jgi:hypothetical protein
MDAVNNEGGSNAWPRLDGGGSETSKSLLLWSQILGKTRLALSPMVNHWWQVPLYVTARGLTTSPMPIGDRVLDVELDFIDHRLEPAGFSTAAVGPRAARYEASVGEFILPYAAVRSAADPSSEVRAFLQSTYVAAADLGKWDREALERNAAFGPGHDSTKRASGKP